MPELSAINIPINSELSCKLYRINNWSFNQSIREQFMNLNELTKVHTSSGK